MNVLTDTFVQIFVLWMVTQFILKKSFTFETNPLKTLTFVTLIFLIIKLGYQAICLGLVSGDLPGQIERFIVDWGVTGSPMRCGGSQPDEDDAVPPTHTASSDIWSDPEKIIDQRIERVLEKTKNEVREFENFLRVTWPDKKD